MLNRLVTREGRVVGKIRRSAFGYFIGFHFGSARVVARCFDSASGAEVFASGALGAAEEGAIASRDTIAAARAAAGGR